MQIDIAGIHHPEIDAAVQRACARKFFMRKEFFALCTSNNGIWRVLFDFHHMICVGHKVWRTDPFRLLYWMKSRFFIGHLPGLCRVNKIAILVDFASLLLVTNLTNRAILNSVWIVWQARPSNFAIRLLDSGSSWELQASIFKRSAKFRCFPLRDTVVFSSCFIVISSFIDWLWNLNNTWNFAMTFFYFARWLSSL